MSESLGSRLVRIPRRRKSRPSALKRPGEDDQSRKPTLGDVLEGLTEEDLDIGPVRSSGNPAPMMYRVPR